jgi:hypothetical protein
MLMLHKRNSNRYGYIYNFINAKTGKKLDLSSCSINQVNLKLQQTLVCSDGSSAKWRIEAS